MFTRLASPVSLLRLFYAVSLLVLSAGASADDSDAPPAEGPYFHVNSDDPAVDRLPLKATQVDVHIAGVIADVKVTQHYRNEGQRPIEARYVFPGSTAAAVQGMTVRLGNRLITAAIREKQQARVEYEAARREGKTAALLEQDRPNVFSMNVANILPGDEVAVELHYTELIALNDRRYQFVFPTVVGPRYRSPAAARSANHFPAIPYLHAGEDSDTRYSIDLQIDAPLPITEVRSPSHALDVQGEGSGKVAVSPRSDDAINNRDFILEYVLSGQRTATGLMLYQGDTENFFLALVEPPKDIRPAQINPRDYIFVVDVSGSMRGQPLNTAKQLLRNLIGSLRASDTFNVMLFSGGSRMLSPTSVPASPANIELAIRTIDDERGGGGTEIVPALRRIAALPKPADLSRTVIVVTDGYVSVESEVFELVRRNLGSSNVFAFGIGSSVNRHLIEGIARAGQGEPFVVTRPDQAAAQAERLRKMIDAPVLTQVRAHFEGMEVYDVEPQVLPDVLGGRPVIIQGKWRGNAQTLGKAKLVVEGHNAEGVYREVVQVPRPSEDAAALRSLWARSRIQQLSDEEALLGGDAQRAAITALGLSYSLLTQYTSFIAVDRIVRTTGVPSAVDQPSPMPEGVSDAAIGAEVPSTPEPAFWLALLLVCAVLGSLTMNRRPV